MTFFFAEELPEPLPGFPSISPTLFHGHLSPCLFILKPPFTTVWLVLLFIFLTYIHHFSHILKRASQIALHIYHSKPYATQAQPAGNYVRADLPLAVAFSLSFLLKEKQFKLTRTHSSGQHHSPPPPQANSELRGLATGAWMSIPTPHPSPHRQASRPAHPHLNPPPPGMSQYQPNSAGT